MPEWIKKSKVPKRYDKAYPAGEKRYYNGWYMVEILPSDMFDKCSTPYSDKGFSVKDQKMKCYPTMVLENFLTEGGLLCLSGEMVVLMKSCCRKVFKDRGKYCRHEYEDRGIVGTRATLEMCPKCGHKKIHKITLTN